ncbi:hypothetical protein OAE97_02710 [Verrucomicrobia bacterium]|nr:hypothetical protein [Verrucomicrobiota bacterium]
MIRPFRYWTGDRWVDVGMTGGLFVGDYVAASLDSRQMVYQKGVPMTLTAMAKEHVTKDRDSFHAFYNPCA